MLQVPAPWMFSSGRDNYALAPLDSRIFGTGPPLNMLAYPLPVNLLRVGRPNPYLAAHSFQDVIPFSYFSNNRWPPVQPLRFYHPQRQFSQDSTETASSSDGSFAGSRPETPTSVTATNSGDYSDQSDAASAPEFQTFPSKGIKRQLNVKQSTKHIPPVISLTHNKSSNSKRQRKQNNRTLPQKSIGNSGWDKLSQQVWTHYLQNKQTRDIYEQKMKLRSMVHHVLCCAFDWCDVYVVGSSMNGFGSSSSDVDMCLILSNAEVDQQIEATQILRNIFKIICKCNFVSHPHLINAKVPLLRFTDCNSGLEVDLNVNNMVGIRNTHLLKCYTYLDWRVQPLVLIIKEWARIHGINNAKDKTLSSYSIVLMVIHYLQCGCIPPVIPCLQRLKPHSFLPNCDVRTLNTSNLPSFKSKNEQPLGELLLGFLDYYSNKFNFSKEAISIRLGSRLPKHAVINYRSEKNKRGHWKYICIEEPFDHTNTACAVYEESSFQFIISTFRASWIKLKDREDLNSVLEV